MALAGRDAYRKKMETDRGSSAKRSPTGLILTAGPPIKPSPSFKIRGLYRSTMSDIR